MVQNKYFRYLLERLAVIYKNSWKETATTSEEIQESGRRKWFNLEIICPSYSAFIQQYLALVARIVLGCRGGRCAGAGSTIYFSPR